MIDNDERDGLPGLPSVIEVAPEDIAKLEQLPLRAQQIGTLLACGFACPDIDRAFTLPDGTSRAYRTKYFAAKSLDLSPQTRDKILAAYFRAKSVEALTHLTPHKLSEAGAGELAKTSALIMQRARELEGTANQQNIGAQISDALSKLSQTVKPKQVT